MSKGDQSDSQRPESLWLATTPETDYGTIEDGLVVDVAVVGGGITGLSTAINLTEAGKRVAVIEADHIVASTTGHTTAKLTSQHGLIYDTLISEFGKEKAQQYADANEAAIDEVQRRVEEHGIDCQFERTQAYTYAASTDDAETIHKEVRAAQRLGLPATFTDMPPLPIDTDAAVRFDDQAQFHPRKYLLALAELIDANGSYVFEKTRAMDIEAGSPSIVETEHGDIIADDIVVATHFPFSTGLATSLGCIPSERICSLSDSTRRRQRRCSTALLHRRIRFEPIQWRATGLLRNFSLLVDRVINRGLRALPPRNDTDDARHLPADISMSNLSSTGGRRWITHPSIKFPSWAR